MWWLGLIGWKLWAEVPNLLVLWVRSILRWEAQKLALPALAATKGFQLPFGSSLLTIQAIPLPFSRVYLSLSSPIFPTTKQYAYSFYCLSLVGWPSWEVPCQMGPTKYSWNDILGTCARCQNHVQQADSPKVTIFCPRLSLLISHSMSFLFHQLGRVPFVETLSCLIILLCF